MQLFTIPIYPHKIKSSATPHLHNQISTARQRTPESLSHVHEQPVFMGCLHTGNSSKGAPCRPPRNPTNSALDLDLHALDLDLPSARHSASCPPMQQFCGRPRRLRAATGTWSGCRQADRLKTPVLGLRTLQPYAPAAF